MKKLAFFCVLLLFVPVIYGHVFSKQDPFFKAIKDIEKSDGKKFKEDVQKINSPHKEVYKTLEGVVRYQQHKVKKEEKKDSVGIKLLKAAGWTIVTVAAIAFAVASNNADSLTGTAISGTVAATTGVLALTDVTEAVLDENDFEKKEKAYKEMKKAIHEEEVANCK